MGAVCNLRANRRAGWSELAFFWPLISAALIVAIVPISMLIAVFQERVVGGLTAGGVKG
jgi:multiple sugar transport system permease protein